MRKKHSFRDYVGDIFVFPCVHGDTVAPWGDLRARWRGRRPVRRLHFDDSRSSVGAVGYHWYFCIHVVERSGRSDWGAPNSEGGMRGQIIPTTPVLRQGQGERQRACTWVFSCCRRGFRGHRDRRFECDRPPHHKLFPCTRTFINLAPMATYSKSRGGGQLTNTTTQMFRSSAFMRLGHVCHQLVGTDHPRHRGSLSARTKAPDVNRRRLSKASNSSARKSM